MKSIFTKVIPATNTKPTRVKAFDSEKRFSVTVTGNSTEDHLTAVKKLKDKLKWSGKMVCGDAGTVVNGMVCVFEDNEFKVNPAKKRKIKRSTKKIVVGVSNGKKNPTNKIKTKKETLFFIYAERGGMKGLFNSSRISLTDDKAEATHYHNKDSAKAAVESLQKKFPKWKWSVKPITFFESK